MKVQKINNLEKNINEEHIKTEENDAGGVTYNIGG